MTKEALKAAVFTTILVVSISANCATNTPYSDTNVLSKYRALGPTATAEQTNQLVNDVKANGINFAWNDSEVIALTGLGATADQENGIKSVLRLAGLIADPARITGNFSSLQLFAGERLQNPYSIAVTNGSGSLKTGNSTSDGFIELDLSVRYIFRTGTYDDQFLSTNNRSDWKDYWRVLFVPRSGHSGLFAPDGDLRMGYTFGGSSTPTNFNASTIAQGADLYLDSSLAEPLFRYDSGTSDTGNRFKAQTTVEIGGGFTTDKNFVEIHPNLFLGAGLQLANLTANSNSFGNLYWITRAGMGIVDQPHLTSTNLVSLDSLGRPQYDWKWTPTVGSTVLWKLNQTFAVQLGANVYFSTVSSWNLSVGVSIDPKSFFGIH